VSKEQDQSPKELSLEKVIHLAKEVTLRDGRHIPTVIADGNIQTAIAQLVELAETHQGRVRQMFITGFALAQSGQVGALKQVFFISEAWMSMVHERKLPDHPPSQDPNRKEILFISNLKVRSWETRMALFEMVRDEQGRLTELKEFQLPTSEAIEAESPLLAAFVDGFDVGMRG